MGTCPTMRWLRAGCVSLLVFVSCVTVQRAIQGTMDLYWGTDSLGVISTEYLEAGYVMDSDLSFTTYGNPYVSEGDRCILAVQSGSPAPTRTLAPLKTAEDYHFVIVFDTTLLHTQTTTDSARALFFHCESRNGNLRTECGVLALEEFAVQHHARDTLLCLMSFHGEAQVLIPHGYFKYRESRPVHGRAVLRANRTNRSKTSSLLAGVRVPQEVQADFLDKQHQMEE